MSKFITAYNRKSLEKPKKFNPIDNVERQYADLCDLNNIMDNYNSNRVLPFKKDLCYSETGVNVADFRNSFDLVEKVNAEFQQLPSDVRKKFGHDVFNYVETLSGAYEGKQQNINFLLNIGLLEPSKQINAESSQSGDDFSVHLSPDDSKKLETSS